MEFCCEVPKWSIDSKHAYGSANGSHDGSERRQRNALRGAFMVDLLLVLSGCFAMGVFMLMFLDPSHESCKQEVRK